MLKSGESGLVIDPQSTMGSSLRGELLLLYFAGQPFRALGY
jgi:hypothetical protein